MGFMPENIASFGLQVDSLIGIITIIVGVAFVVAEAILLYSLIRYRRRQGQRASYLTGTGWRQLKWVFVPLVVVVSLDMYIDIRTTSVWKTMKQELPEKGVHVSITGQQFAWKFGYPGFDGELDTGDDLVLINELHVPVNTDVIFHLKAKDVLHSFWVPTLRLKQDAVPGRTILGWFNAEKAGEFEIACAEICGTGHSQMRATLYVHSQSDYGTWLQQKLAPPAVSAAAELPGKALFTSKGCVACHTTDGSRLVGPSLKGVFGTKEKVVTDGVTREILVNEEYVRKSLSEPGADLVKTYPPMMPKLPLSEEEIEQLLAFVISLGVQPPAPMAEDNQMPMGHEHNHDQPHDDHDAH